jgi:hypothetical protein
MYTKEVTSLKDLKCLTIRIYEDEYKLRRQEAVAHNHESEKV